MISGTLYMFNVTSSIGRIWKRLASIVAVMCGRVEHRHSIQPNPPLLQC